MIPQKVFLGYAFKSENIFFPSRLIFAESKEEAEKKLTEYYKKENIKINHVVILDTII